MNTTINGNVLFLTKKGIKELKHHINQLEHDRKKLLKSLRESDKTQGKEERFNRVETVIMLDNLTSELQEKHEQLNNSRLLPATRSHLRVMLGSVVDLIDKHGRLFRYKLVNSLEANPSDGRISTSSPLGSSLIGKSLQDVIESKNGNELNRFTLIRIF